MATDPNAQVNVVAQAPQVETISSPLPNQLPLPSLPSTTAPTPTTSATGSSANMIRNISQTAQEREIIKTCPDIIVYIEGLPYLLNWFVPNQTNSTSYTLVNFNDHVSSFSVSYDIDSLIPAANIGIEVPNFLKYLYAAPGGNNLIQPMMQVQVYAKGYFMDATGDTVYRRVFKGLVSHVGYNDNGKMLDISVQCQGILYLLELMQINESPSIMSSQKNSTNPTYFQSIFASSNPYQIIENAFTYAFKTDGFQLTNLTQSSVASGAFGQAVQKGYMVKWQAILANLRKDVHIFGIQTKDNPPLPGDPLSPTKDSDVKKSANRNEQPHSIAQVPVKNEVNTLQQDIYYQNIQAFHPDLRVSELSLFNSNIVNRLELVRKMVQLINFEAYQDVDGKVIIKPPLYNLDVLNLGTQMSQTSTQTSTNAVVSGTTSNSLNNPLTRIYANNNPFVIQLSEILTEQETEDQAAIRRTRMVVCGRYSKDLQITFEQALLGTVEWVDVPRLCQFGLREEPTIYVPWIEHGQTAALFAHAVSEVTRSNRGYRTYTVTIPLRPELKVGFPAFFPHRDMYGYIKNIQINYQLGGTANMTLTCDSIRRRVLAPAPQSTGGMQGTTSSGLTPGAQTSKNYSLLTSAPNLVLKYTTGGPSPITPNALQSPNNTTLFGQSSVAGISSGNSAPTSNDPANKSMITNSTYAINSTQASEPSSQQNRVAQIPKKTRNVLSIPKNTVAATYNVVNDTAKKFAVGPNGRKVDATYLNDLMGGTIPYTDDKGYELIGPFPWGRWQDLNTTIHNFTQAGWIGLLANSVGNSTSVPAAQQPPTFNDLIIEQNTDAFLFAGLGTPTATNDNSSQLIAKLSQIQGTVGGATPATPGQSSALNTPEGVQPDATVIVLQYNNATGQGSGNDSSLLNTAQPENAIAQAQLSSIRNIQQTINVLVTGSVSPTPAVQEALLATKTQTPYGLISLTGKP
jgi:hypothetical protein